jgi:hypothetical protein
MVVDLSLTVGVDLKPKEESLVRQFNEPKASGVGVLLRSSIYCTVLAAFFLYLAIARHEPLYSIGIFGMFVLYLAIRIFSARRISGIMPRIIQRYEFRIAELEARLSKLEGSKPAASPEKPTT